MELLFVECKPAMASRLGLEQVNDEGTLEIGHEICD